VQVDPTKPKLKPPGTKRLKLKCDKLLSNFAFNFNLRRYTESTPPAVPPTRLPQPPPSPQVGLCRLTLSKTILKAPMVSALETTMC